MSNTKLIIDCQYFGNITYYKYISEASYCFIEEYDDHKKKSFANRMEIAGANGSIHLSVPLEKGRSQRTISKDLRISNAEKWQLRHLRSLISSYNNSPWFKYLSDDLAGLYWKKKEFLLDWNLSCLDWTARVLKLDVGFELTNSWVENPAGVVDVRNKILPGTLGGIESLRYPQVFEHKFGFISGLCILDLIFCEGPKSAMSFLKSQG